MSEPFNLLLWDALLREAPARRRPRPPGRVYLVFRAETSGGVWLTREDRFSACYREARRFLSRHAAVAAARRVGLPEGHVITEPGSLDIEPDDPAL